MGRAWPILILLGFCQFCASWGSLAIIAVQVEMRSGLGVSAEDVAALVWAFSFSLAGWGLGRAGSDRPLGAPRSAICLTCLARLRRHGTWICAKLGAGNGSSGSYGPRCRFSDAHGLSHCGITGDRGAAPGRYVCGFWRAHNIISGGPANLQCCGRGSWAGALPGSWREVQLLLPHLAWCLAFLVAYAALEPHLRLCLRSWLTVPHQ